MKRNSILLIGLIALAGTLGIGLYIHNSKLYGNEQSMKQILISNEEPQELFNELKKARKGKEETNLDLTTVFGKYVHVGDSYESVTLLLQKNGFEIHEAVPSSENINNKSIFAVRKDRAESLFMNSYEIQATFDKNQLLEDFSARAVFRGP